MRRIIGGKRYNTDSATEIADWSNDYGTSDSRNCSEQLYRSPGGRYFLVGQGGGMTRWAECNGNVSWEGEGLIALTPAEALAWCEQHHIDIPAAAVEILALVVDA